MPLALRKVSILMQKGDTLGMNEELMRRAGR